LRPFYPAENLGVQKLVHIKDNSQLSVRMDYFNAFNRYQLGYPTSNISSSSLGEIISKTGGGNRQGQISAILLF